MFHGHLVISGKQRWFVVESLCFPSRIHLYIVHIIECRDLIACFETKMAFGSPEIPHAVIKDKNHLFKALHVFFLIAHIFQASIQILIV